MMGHCGATLSFTSRSKDGVEHGRTKSPWTGITVVVNQVSESFLFHLKLAETFESANLTSLNLLKFEPPTAFHVQVSLRFQLGQLVRQY